MNMDIKLADRQLEAVTSSKNDDAIGMSICPICGELFDSACYMRNHLEVVHRKYQCEICRKLMSHKRNVDRHRKSVHENKRAFGCPICPYRSAHKQVVKRHLSTKHRRETANTEVVNMPVVDDNEISGVPITLDYTPFDPPWLMSNLDFLMPDGTFDSGMDVNGNNFTGEDNNSINNVNIVNDEDDDNNNNNCNEIKNKNGSVGEDELIAAFTGVAADSTSSSATINKLNDDVAPNGDKPAMTAQVSFEHGQVRIVFQRASNVHVVKIPFPDI